MIERNEELDKIVEFANEKGYIGGDNELRALIKSYAIAHADMVKQELDDATRFISALFIQSGGSMTVTNRSLREIPVPSKVNFQQLSNIDGSITMVLREVEATNNV